MEGSIIHVDLPTGTEGAQPRSPSRFGQSTDTLLRCKYHYRIVGAHRHPTTPTRFKHAGRANSAGSWHCNTLHSVHSAFLHVSLRMSRMVEIPPEATSSLGREQRHAKLPPSPQSHEAGRLFSSICRNTYPMPKRVPQTLCLFSVTELGGCILGILVYRGPSDTGVDRQAPFASAPQYKDYAYANIPPSRVEASAAVLSYAREDKAPPPRQLRELGSGGPEPSYPRPPCVRQAAGPATERNTTTTATSRQGEHLRSTSNRLEPGMVEAVVVLRCDCNKGLGLWISTSAWQSSLCPNESNGVSWCRGCFFKKQSGAQGAS